MNTTKNLLDTDVPNINAPLLKPTKYVSRIKSLIKSSKEKSNNLFNKSKEEVLNLFDKYRNNVNKGTEKITNWYNVLDIFNKISSEALRTSCSQFKLDQKDMKWIWKMPDYLYMTL